MTNAQAWAQESPSYGPESTQSETTETKDAKTDVDLLIAPVPFSSPTTGAGIAAGAVAFYNPNDGLNQWTTGAGVVWTSRGSRGAAVFHSMSSADDGFRLEAQAAYLKQETHYYGVGADDGERGDALALDDTGFNLKVRALMRISPSAYLGGRYVLATHDAEPDAEDLSATPAPPADQRSSTLSSLGPAFVFDTRDDHEQPRRGVYVDATWLFGLKALGDSYSHNKLNANARIYQAVGTNTVAAAKVAICSAGGDVPYYDLCLFGSGGNLRGYPSGRYRDRASWAIQGELRHAFSSRWGGVAFAGLGGIAPSFGDLVSHGNLLPGAGLGVRYRPFKDNDVRLRIDVAIGRDTSGVYLGIGEAF